MKLRLNGDETEFAGDPTVSGLLDTLNIEPGRVAVEVNMKIVKKCDYGNQVLNEGDTIEIVNFVGGG